MWIEKSVPLESGTPAPAPEVCGAVTSDAPGGTGGAGEFIKVKALLCDGPVTGVSPTKDGSCATFESASSMPLSVGQWEYFGFSFDEFTKKGTFIVNKMFGYQGRAEKVGQSYSADSTTCSTLKLSLVWFGWPRQQIRLVGFGWVWLKFGFD